MKTFNFISRLAFLALLITACARSAPPEPEIYTIEMNEYSFNPNTLDLKVGQQVTINID